MDFMDDMSNEELLREYEWMVISLPTHNSPERIEYKEKLKTEILLRLNE